MIEIEKIFNRERAVLRSHEKVGINFVTVLVFYCYYNTITTNFKLTSAQIYYLTIMRIGSPKWGSLG